MGFSTPPLPLMACSDGILTCDGESSRLAHAVARLLTGSRFFPHEEVDLLSRWACCGHEVASSTRALVAQLMTVGRGPVQGPNESHNTNLMGRLASPGTANPT